METYSPIGFLAQGHRPAAVASFQPEQNNQYLLRFDDGTGITMDDANCNVLVLGSTGSGKTSCVIMPAVYSVFSAGYFGVIVDIKGNLGPQVREIASFLGREDDIVELGTSSQATPVNLLAYMADVELRNLFEDLLYKRNISSHNQDFHQHGIEYVLDICKFLQIVQQFDKRYSLSLEIVERLLRNPEEGHQLYAHFLEKWFNKHNQEHMKLYLSLKNSEHHPLCRPDSRASSYWEQYTYATHAILGAISMLTTTPAIVQNFFSGDAVLDFKSLVYNQKRVVLLRFAAQAEAAGEILSRILLSMFYRVMLSPCGLKVDKNEKTFVIIDEFQQIMDLTGRFSDDKVLARSREFNNIFLVASQSMAGMYAKAGGNKDAVHAMLTNYREKIIFNCDDPDTYEWIHRYNVDARCLPLGKVVALRSRQSEQSAGTSKFLHKAHASVQKLVKAASTQGCDLCEVEACTEELPSIARYQKPHKKLDTIFDAYRNAEITFAEPLTLKDFAGVPNRTMWLELAKKFSDCFEWQTQKTKQIIRLFNKPELNAESMGQLCKTLSRVKAVGLLPKIQDFTFQENVLVLQSNQGADMDKALNAIAADTTILQEEQEIYARKIQELRNELQSLQHEKDTCTIELHGDADYDEDYLERHQIQNLNWKIEKLLSTIADADKNTHYAASWCVSCSQNEKCAVFNAYKELSCTDSKQQPKSKKPRESPDRIHW